MVHRQVDFRGGYQSSMSPELTPESVLKQAENLYWLGRIKKRPGFDNHSSDSTINSNTVRGFARVYMNSTWTNIVAIDNATNVQFYRGDTGSYTVINSPATYTWTTGTDVEMAVFEDKVVAVNGTDKPAVIYYESATYKVQNLEAYDARARGDDEWYAGQWDDSETPPFVDDTSDAQSSTADDFQISSGTNNDGFYVAGVTTFNKIVLKNCPDLGTSVTAEIRYYAGSDTWTALTVTSEPDWVAAEGDKTLEFDLPFAADGTLAWKTYGDVDTQVDPTGVAGGALNRYIARVRFTTADTAGSADSLEVSNTQYLSQILLNEKPQAVEVHQSRVFLGIDNAFRFSPPNDVKNWDSRDIEYCAKGGEEIRAMVSAQGRIVILKDAGVYMYYGTTTNNFVLRHYGFEGVTSKRGAANINGNVIYVADDGIRLIAGEDSILVSRHIDSDLLGYTRSDAVVSDFNGNVIISFPTDTILLWADPDFVRPNELQQGEALMAFWKWTGHAFDQMLYADGASDQETLIAHDSANNRLVKSNGNAYDTDFAASQTNIQCTWESSFMSMGEANTKKNYQRVKFDLSKSGNYTLTITGDNGDATATATISSGSGSSHYYADISIPYTLDGQNIAYKLVNQTANDVEIFAVSTEYKRRAF